MEKDDSEPFPSINNGGNSYTCVVHVLHLVFVLVFHVSFAEES